MTILALDPGSTETGWCILESGDKITDKGKDKNEVLLTMLADCSFDGVDTVAIEWCSGYGVKAGNEVFETCRWEARFEIRSEQIGGEVMHVRRRDVKSHLCENPTADDKAVREAMLDRFGVQGTKKNPGPTWGFAGDMWAALACAAYALDKLEGKVSG